MTKRTKRKFIFDFILFLIIVMGQTYVWFYSDSTTKSGVVLIGTLIFVIILSIGYHFINKKSK